MRSIIQQRLADAVSMDIPPLVEREYRLPEIPNKAYAIIGMRRVGKTYFLYQTMNHLTPIFTAGLIVKVTPQSSGPDYLHGFTGKPWNSKRFL